MKNIRLETVRTQSTYGTAPVRTTITVWRNPQIPGQIVKFGRIIEGAGLCKEEGVVVDYRALNATPAEISRLRAERRPRRVEEFASTFVLEELRYFQNDLESFQKKQEPLVKMYQYFDPAHPAVEWTSLIAATQDYRDGIREVKDHLAEDILKFRRCSSRRTSRSSPPF